MQIILLNSVWIIIIEVLKYKVFKLIQQGQNIHGILTSQDVEQHQSFVVFYVKQLSHVIRNIFDPPDGALEIMHVSEHRCHFKQKNVPNTLT